MGVQAAREGGVAEGPSNQSCPLMRKQRTPQCVIWCTPTRRVARTAARGLVHPTSPHLEQRERLGVRPVLQRLLCRFFP